MDASPSTEAVLNVLREYPGQFYKFPDLATRTNLNRNALDHAITGLLNQRLILRTTQGYSLRQAPGLRFAATEEFLAEADRQEIKAAPMLNSQPIPTSAPTPLPVARSRPDEDSVPAIRSRPNGTSVPKPKEAARPGKRLPTPKLHIPPTAMVDCEYDSRFGSTQITIQQVGEQEARSIELNDEEMARVVAWWQQVKSEQTK